MEALAFFGIVAVLAVATSVVIARQQRRALVPAEDEVRAVEDLGDAELRQGSMQDVIEVRRYQGTQYRTELELRDFHFLEVQRRRPGGPLRLDRLPEPQRTLARSLDGPEVFIQDDRVRLRWQDDGGFEAQRLQVIMLFTLLASPADALVVHLERRLLQEAAHPQHGTSRRREWLGRLLEYLARLPEARHLAEQVRPADPPELRLRAALILEDAEAAFALATPRLSTALCLRVVDTFSPDPRVEPLLSLLLASGEEAQAVAHRVRALPREAAIRVLEPSVSTLPAALTLLAMLAPEAAEPHLRAAVSQRTRPELRRIAATLLHPADPEAAELALLALAEEDWSGRLVTVADLGRLGADRSVPALIELAEHTERDLAEAAEHALAEVRGRLKDRPVGSLALAEASDGGLSLARPQGGLSEPESEP